MSKIIKKCIGEFVMIHTELFTKPITGYVREVDEEYVLIEQVLANQPSLDGSNILSKPFDIIPVKTIVNIHGINPSDLKKVDKKNIDLVKNEKVPLVPDHKNEKSITEQFDVNDEDQMPTSYISQLKREEDMVKHRMEYIKNTKDVVD